MRYELCGCAAAAGCWCRCLHTANGCARPSSQHWTSSCCDHQRARSGDCQRSAYTRRVRFAVIMFVVRSLKTRLTLSQSDLESVAVSLSTVGCLIDRPRSCCQRTGRYLYISRTAPVSGAPVSVDGHPSLSRVSLPRRRFFAPGAGGGETPRRRTPRSARIETQATRAGRRERDGVRFFWLMSYLSRRHRLAFTALNLMY